MKKEDLKLLKEEKFLTSDSFQSPDRNYIFLDENNEIKFMGMGDVVYNYNEDIYKNITYRKVERKYLNFDFITIYN